ncbi:MAG: hypothetical protein HC803_04435, partial [Saprospiraceae bacterium]|nr:hypothetical protein [Saprospiraceae bacterium]
MSKTNHHEILVQDIPVVNAGTDTLVCRNQPTFTLTGYSPAGGTWSGTGIVDANLGTFNPSINSGTYVLTYTYIDPVTGCQNTDTKIVTVSPLPVVTVPSTITHCLIPDDITLTNYNPAGGTWSGAGIVDANNGIFNGDAAGGVGTYTVVYTYTDGNQCTNSDAMDIIINPLDTAEAGPGDTLCVYDSPINLTGHSPAGGVWSGTGIINSANGTFDPGQVSAGSYTITYTVNSGTCQDLDQTTVLVGGIPNVNAQADEFVCEGEPAFTLITATPANGVWSGTGIIDAVNGVFDPVTAGVGLHTLTYSYTNPITGCSNSDTKNVRVHPLPAVSTQGAAIYCNTPSNIQLTGFTPTTGGIWSGPGIVDANNGVFNPITAGNVGVYNIVLTYTNSNNCTNFDTLQITVTAGDTVNAGPNDTLCIDDAPIMLGGYPAGGVWSGSGITNSSGIFDPGQVAAGFHYPIYTVGTGTCERKDTITIFVSGLPFVNAGNDIQMCIDAGLTTLTGQTPLTGYWAGNGIIDSIAGTFDPVLAGAGLHTISYIVTNVYGCDNVDTRTIRVYPLPTVNAGDTVIYCYTSDNIQLTGFTPSSGGMWSGTGI